MFLWSSLRFTNVFRDFFQRIFSKEFGKVWKTSLEKVWKKVWKPERTPKEHVSSETICPTLSELCFRADVRRHDHVAVYDDDNIKKSKLARQPTRSSAGPVCYSPVPAQGSLRRRLQTQRGTRMASARRGISTTDDDMQWRWTGNPVGIAIPVTKMVKRQISVRVSKERNAPTQIRG